MFGDLDLFQVDLLLKARPATEGETRFIYTEPSNDSWDADNQRVLQKALASSAEHFLRFGNLDLQHMTLFGWKMGLPNPWLYEIGKPVEVIADGRRFRVDDKQHVSVESNSALRDAPIMVKGEIYQKVTTVGEVRKPGSFEELGDAAEFFWSSLTRLVKPKVWYPSVGGTKPKVKDVPGGQHVVGVEWTNIGFANQPVNESVVPVTTMAPAEFAKAVVAGYGTDSATLTGGAALRRQSLEPEVLRSHQQDFPERKFRKAVMDYVTSAGLGSCPAGHDWPCRNTHGQPTLAKLTGYFRDCAGMQDPVLAKACAERLLRDVSKRSDPRGAVAEGRMAA